VNRPQWGIESESAPKVPQRFGMGCAEHLNPNFDMSVVAGQYKAGITAKDPTEDIEGNGTGPTPDCQSVKGSKQALTLICRSSYRVTSK